MNKPASRFEDKDSKQEANDNAGSDPVSDALDPILNDLEIPEDKKQKIKAAFVSITYQRASTFSGPLPPPSILGEYSSVVQNGAERIMKMTENQSAHRIAIPTSIILYLLAGDKTLVSLLANKKIAATSLFRRRFNKLICALDTTGNAN